MKLAVVVVMSLLLVSVATVRGVVLVLGSGGLIGGVLVRHLVRAGIPVEQVRDRRHIDLRVRGALDVFNRSGIQYCFFLACEVGGSKFLEDSDPRVQLSILESNLRMYQSVLPWLEESRVHFAFTSSYLQGTQNSYGVVKRLGEQWVRHLGLGRTFRLWNVYGPEATGPKSHVLSDWATACVRDGVVNSRTDGHEMRRRHQQQRQHDDNSQLHITCTLYTASDACIYTQTNKNELYCSCAYRTTDMVYIYIHRGRLLMRP